MASLRGALLSALCVSMIGACSWVKVSDEGETVRLLTAEQAAGCERLGQVTANVLDRVAFINRSAEKQRQELATLARNEAGTMGANAIVPASEIADGRQRFDAYKCQ